MACGASNYFTCFYTHDVTMCYSFKVSIISYALSMCAGMYALYNRLPILGLLIIAYAQMQLSEAVIWYGLDNNNDQINRLGTSIGAYTLPLHNLALGIGVLISYRANLSQFEYWIPLIAGLAFYAAVWYCRIRPPHSRPQETRATGKGIARLAWPFSHGWYPAGFLLSCAILVVYARPFSPVAPFLLLAFAAIALMTWTKAEQAVFPSFWCWTSAILAPLIAGLAVNLADNTTHG